MRNTKSSDSNSSEDEKVDIENETEERCHGSETPNKYTDMIKTALKYLEKTDIRKEHYPTSKILEYLYANSIIRRKSKTDKNHFNEALKKMVASKELIECTKKTRSKKNSISYYKLSNN